MIYTLAYLEQCLTQLVRRGLALCKGFFLRFFAPFCFLPVFQPEYLSCYIGWNDDLFFCILYALFFKPLFPINHDFFQLDWLFYSHGAGLAALEQLIFHNVVCDVLALF